MDTTTAPISRLQHIITSLKHGLTSGGGLIKYVRYPQVLINTLQQCNSLPYSDEIKDNIVDMVNTIIAVKICNQHDPHRKKSPLNMILYEPKFARCNAPYNTYNSDIVNIAGKLAKIIYAIGYFDLSIDRYVDVPEVSEDKLLTIVTSQDVVLSNVDSTYPKISELLHCNIGGFLLIDNVHDLYRSNGDIPDHHGQELLDYINQFLSDHPNDIVVIFAGIKSQIEDVIFRIQPGLDHRLWWRFDSDQVQNRIDN